MLSIDPQQIYFESGDQDMSYTSESEEDRHEVFRYQLSFTSSSSFPNSLIILSESDQIMIVPSSDALASNSPDGSNLTQLTA
ncbi:hypothetical protein OGAPHI_002045 [Ogataea philodendri]|uniref:Uncharacterized protein n=1 Tax=Ogataea philodendri TaxID=1378263 RepID=A0A9P8PAQ0_9ASCO|nr:uncharacterized protein OGAPHI_002045 [Ogataea philodendri]KAH3668291.1 hypothetical protein OGAPHI_002045 [Ogataea philodendri]